MSATVSDHEFWDLLAEAAERVRVYEELVPWRERVSGGAPLIGDTLMFARLASPREVLRLIDRVRVLEAAQ